MLLDTKSHIHSKTTSMINTVLGLKIAWGGRGY